MSTLTTVILAAGEGTRMRSRLPKALHRLGGRPLVHYPVRVARRLGGRIVVVVGRGGEEFRRGLGEGADLTFVEQKERLGTGHALHEARSACGNGEGPLLVLPCDVPMLSESSLRRLVDHHRAGRAAVTLLTAVVEDPTGYGRVVRDDGRVVAVVEERDALLEQKTIQEINTSIYCFDAGRLWPALERVRNHNAQGEYYLTDVIEILVREGERVEALEARDPVECLGVNDRKELAHCAALLRRRTLDRLMAEGVTILDPATTYVDDTVAVGPDTVLYPGVILEGATAVGAECVIGPGCYVSESQIRNRVTLRPYCVLTDSTVDEDAVLGPFCHLRPLSHVGPRAKIGNFVELKKSRIGRGSKVPHLSYVGDATVGEDVNVGAGTITCNYDGVAKHETRIGDRAFVGTNVSLVAPITIGEGAYIGAGSTITKDVPPGALAVGRAKQVVKKEWALKRPKKKPEVKKGRGES
ncbi:MAG: bifunctional UDP-N-acetylglucosamine diphosphorylase/glucosamine-1-phosphate N-acetyltransferase GlmU [Candidatus Methylomirabilia bacterium]